MRIACMVALVAAAGLLPPGAASARSEYRKIKNGVGNCIFSTQGLPFQKEGTYRDVKTSFTAPERPKEARCYFPAPLRDLARKGKVYNELRDTGRYRMVVSVEGHKPDAYTQRQRVMRFPNPNVDWSQQRLILDRDSGRCAIKSFGRDEGTSAGCANLEKVTRKIAREEKAGLPFTARVCLAIQMEYANRVVEVVDQETGHTSTHPKAEGWVFSAGCFDYTVKQ